MPELPEVETIRRDLVKHVKGETIRGVKALAPATIQGITPDRFSQAVAGATVTDVKRRGKLLLFDLSSGYTMLAHLKMTGQFVDSAHAIASSKYARVVFDLGRGRKLYFNDMRRFGYFKLLKTEELRLKPEVLALGPEPLASDFTADRLRDMLHRRPRGRIKPLLIDQAFIAGIGNIYADEILHHAHIRPTRRVGRLTKREIVALHEGMKKILTAATEKRGTSTRDYIDLAGRAGGYVPHLKVYRREGEGCLRGDGGTIKRVKLGGRSSYFCPTCQR